MHLFLENSRCGDDGFVHSIFNDAIASMDRYTQIRREIHRYPEVSNNEENTARIIENELDALEIPYVSGIAGHGIVATIAGSKPGKTVGLRADMDALRIQEDNQVEYKSSNMGCMHACGHDAHMAILLHTGNLLQSMRETFSGKIKLIFQPAEEMSPVGGSRRMLASGAIDDLDVIYGLHVWPDLPFGHVGIKSGALMAASDHFLVKIYGKASHAAQPHEGIDSILVGADFVKNVQSIVSRRINPLRTAVVSIGMFNGGVRYNIVAPECTLEGTVRTFDVQTRNQVQDEISSILEKTCNMYGAQFDLKYERGYMPVINDKYSLSIIESAALSLFGEENVHYVEDPSTIAEDFAFYLESIPGAFVWLGLTHDGFRQALHTSKFDLDERIIPRGAALLTQTAVQYLNKM